MLRHRKGDRRNTSINGHFDVGGVHIEGVGHVRADGVERDGDGLTGFVLFSLGVEADSVMVLIDQFEHFYFFLIFPLSSHVFRHLILIFKTIHTFSFAFYRDDSANFPQLS